MLTPSSNTALEPICGAIVAETPDITVHFSRFRVTEITLTETADEQFSHDGMLRAAELLADARVDAICWNGTSASWLGFERDRELCASITGATGVAATSSVLAMVEQLREAGMSRVGLVAPYLESVQRRIVETLASESFDVVAERHLGLSENFAFAEVGATDIAAMIRDVARFQPQAILVMCTNLRAAPLVEALERELDIPILDSVATAVRGGLRISGVDPARVRRWGRLFTGFEPSASSRPVA